MEHPHNHETTAVDNNLRMGVFLIPIIPVAEVAGGILTNSIVLRAYADHVLTDVVALAFSWYGEVQSRRSADHRMTYGYHRIGVLIAVVNAPAIIFVSGFILYESIRCLSAPPEVRSVPMLIAATIGLAVNVFVAFWLLGERKGNLNLRSAFWHAAGDALASCGSYHRRHYYNLYPS